MNKDRLQLERKMMLYLHCFQENSGLLNKFNPQQGFFFLGKKKFYVKISNFALTVSKLVTFLLSHPVLSIHVYLENVVSRQFQNSKV